MTLSACSAAFAAMSTALLCIIILNGRSNNDLLQGSAQSRLTSVTSYHLDAPYDAQTLVKCIASDHIPSLKRRQYGRRAISSFNENALAPSNEDAPEGVVWLMVSSLLLRIILWPF